MPKLPRRENRVPRTPYYPSQERGNQMLVLDDRTMIGVPRIS